MATILPLNVDEPTPTKNLHTSEFNQEVKTNKKEKMSAQTTGQCWVDTGNTAIKDGDRDQVGRCRGPEKINDENETTEWQKSNQGIVNLAPVQSNRNWVIFDTVRVKPRIFLFLSGAYYCIREKTAN